jgi:FKBP-type peptidyl-prolyl cis-trans isomerase FklB
MSDNLQAGQAFLAEKAAEEGVTVLPSGLVFKAITVGSGATPGPTDNVTVHYRGTLIDGTVFDSSYDRGQPATFPVNRVIPGWVEALQLMTEGSKWELYIPSDLAYGKAGAGADIGPDSTLIFEVELLKIV